MDDIYDKVMELSKRRGFVWQSSECYGSVAGFIDYGPLGATMKRRIENKWRDFFVIQEGFYEIECPTVGPEAIYIASGHVRGFADKMCTCPHCGDYFRADHIAEEHGAENAGSLSADALKEYINKAKCPVCGEEFGDIEIYDFNLMFHTFIGPGAQRKGYLRPETAQGIFTDFARLLRYYRDKLPFGAVQIGKSYRNEISPRQGMIRLREFTQAEAEIFVHPGEKRHPQFDRYAEYRMPLLGAEQQQGGGDAETFTMRDAVDSGLVANEYVAYYLALTHELLLAIGMDQERIRFRQHMPDERAHYAADCWDAEAFSGRFGWVEIVGIADRTDYDLKAHAKESGDPFTVFIPYENPKTVRRKRIVPDMGVIGPRFRGQAKKIIAALEQAEPSEDSVTVEIDGEKITITPDIYEIRDDEIEVRGEDVMPHVIEPSFGIDRMLYSVLEHSYDEEEVEGELRRVLRFPAHISPVQAAVLPLMTRDGLDDLAKKIVKDLHENRILAEYDDSGAIGRRYRRQDEIGTPFAVTIDYDSLEDGTVTIRSRDSMEQVRVPYNGLPELLRLLIEGKKEFESL